ncbi:hypothetical protein PV407_08145 [Paenibacillus sp. GYB003]
MEDNTGGLYTPSPGSVYPRLLLPGRRRNFRSSWFPFRTN